MQNRFLRPCAAILAAFSCLAGAQTEYENRDSYDPGAKWKLVWQDEFEGSRLDTSIWSYDLGQGQWGWGNNEWQVYTSSAENIWLRDGLLHIRAIRNFTGNGGYTSARINTKDKKQFQFGKIAARIKLPRGRAVWPAFWMMGSVSDLDPWPFSGEIDIMEMRGGQAHEFKDGDGGDKKIYGSLHYYNSLANGHVAYGESVSLDRPFADEFHVFEVEWYDTHILYKLDGKAYGIAQYNGVNEMHEFRAWPYYLLLQVAVGGPDTPFTGRLMPDDSVFPQTMQVDWVRVYQTADMMQKETKAYQQQGITHNISSESLEQAGHPIADGMRLDVWNPDGFTVTNDSSAAEGREATVLRSDGTQSWFGVGYTVGRKVDLGGYRFLTLSLRTTSQAAFKIGASHSYGSWVYFVPGHDPYGFKRDGQWHTLHIPMRDFLQPEFDWGHVDYPFALVAAGLKGPTEIAVDNVYFDNRSSNPDDYLLIPKGAEYYFEKDDRLGAADELQGEMNAQVWTWHGFERTSQTADCVRGKDCLRFIADGSGHWFGVAYAGTSPTRLLDYTRLEFSIRTRSQGRLKVGMVDDKGQELWFKLQDSPYALPRDGQWHAISLPLSGLTGLNIKALKTVFALVGEDAVPYDIELDAVKIRK
jgi:beta-glucanase (GH16 family)